MEKESTVGKILQRSPGKAEKGGLEQAEDGFGAVSVKSGRQVRDLALNGIRPLQRKSVDGTR